MVFLNPIFSMLYSWWWSTFSWFYFEIYQRHILHKKERVTSFQVKYLFYLRRSNLNLKLILSAKDWYKEQLKWEHTFCILFVFVACCEMSLKNFVHTPINTEQQHRIQEKRDTVLKFAPWIVFNKNVNHHSLNHTHILKQS